MKNGFKIVWLIVVVTLLFGCASKKVQPEDAGAAGDESSDVTAPGDGADSTGAEQAGGFTGHPLDDPSSPLHQRVIYFEYDSSAIALADQEVLSAHGRYLANNPAMVVSLEGHADERGSREYNIALGERRAQAVRQVLELNGAQRQQLKTISYGEEKPVDFGHDESAWHLNRRVEIVYPSH